ncbi:hypothetical protein P4O66_016325 [Electrophorus voltai]|uniref:Uncharacterized protein n=1 Tax=Electrophorus voltai TaxID=2609070 RepID=A0AAD8YXP2_9TELE|nr:hypothetical protein P4O66_016325 [Electrophorus voltai]
MYWIDAQFFNQCGVCSTPLCLLVSVPTKRAGHGSEEALNWPRSLLRNSFLCLVPGRSCTISGGDTNFRSQTPLARLFNNPDSASTTLSSVDAHKEARNRK